MLKISFYAFVLLLFFSNVYAAGFRNAIFQAVADKNLNRVKQIVSSDRSAVNAECYAIKIVDIENFRMEQNCIKNFEIDPNGVGKDTLTYTPIYFAIRSGDAEMVKYLISSGANVKRTFDTPSIDCGDIYGIDESLFDLLIDYNPLNYDEYKDFSITEKWILAKMLTEKGAVPSRYIVEFFINASEISDGRTLTLLKAFVNAGYNDFSMKVYEGRPFDEDSFEDVFNSLVNKAIAFNKPQTAKYLRQQGAKKLERVVIVKEKTVCRFTRETDDGNFEERLEVYDVPESVLFDESNAEFKNVECDCTWAHYKLKLIYDDGSSEFIEMESGPQCGNEC